MRKLAAGRSWWHPRALSILLEAGADTGLLHKDKTPYQIAFDEEENCARFLSLWYDEGLDVLLRYEADVNEGLPLHAALRANRDLSVIQRLLDHGADPSVGNHPAIACAIQAGSVSAVKLLLKAGVDPNVVYTSKDEHRGERTETPLIEASGKSEELMAVLLAHGADSHQALEKGTSALHEICTRHGLVTPIIAAGHDLERRDAQGQTPLLRACEQRGKSKNAGLHEDDREHTALALIRAGANIHVADNPGSTALHYAVLNNLREVVEELLARGASTVAHNTHGLSPLHVALAESIDRSVDEDAMPSLRFKWNLERLGAAGANATERFPDGRTAPHFIAPVLMQCTAKDIEERAISTGSDEKDEGLYPACLALYQLFLDKGCSREARDNQGNTPIFAYVNQLRVYHMDEYTASPPEESDLRRMFAEHEVHAVNGNGDTLLHVVARRKDDPIDVPYDDEGNLFALLVELGLDPTRENKDGVTAREVAAACDKWSILDSTRNG